MPRVSESISMSSLARAPRAALPSPPASSRPTSPSDRRSVLDRFRDALKGLRVLVVDDNADCLELLCLALTRAGATVRGAESAAEARASVASFEPDVLVSDLSMPGENGFDLVRSVRSTAHGTKERLHAIALSAHARAEDRASAYAAGFDAHLPKPVDLLTLMEALAERARRGA
jgi:CheY-like chemotaxis protein